MRKRYLLIVLLSIFIISCDGKDIGKNEVQNEVNSQSSDLTEESSDSKILMSNMADNESLNQVEKALKSKIEDKSVDEFLALVDDYNRTIEFTSLNKGFEEYNTTKYDIENIFNLWQGKKGAFIGTNCRINTFTLLKDNIEIGDINGDDGMLFMDLDAIDKGDLFTKEETDEFVKLFSRVKTEASLDTDVHAKYMIEHLSNVKFNTDADMISVVVNDNLDGDYLFIGHVGVMVPYEDEYIFVEKLSFDEPYQAIKCDKKEDCFKYLYNKYKDYHDDNTSEPFLMENESYIDPKIYK